MRSLILSKPGLSRFAAVWIAVLACVSACTEQASPVQKPDPSELQPGGGTTTGLVPFPAFDKPATNLPDHLKADFFAGRALAEQPWVKAPTITDARDGLGPVYNARACLACHIRGGKGRLPDDNQSPLFNAFVRVSLPAGDQTIDPAIGVIPEPVYGDQLQGQSIALLHQVRQATPEEITAAGDVAPEAYVYINWTTHTYTYPDKHQTELRKPSLDIRNLGYGPLHKDTLFSLRNAPSIHGMGLLERIAQSDIDAFADPDDSNHDGISGRVNMVWDAVSGQTVPGRFGLKANRPNMEMVVASAFANDVGISNPLFPRQPCSSAQVTCLKQANGNNEDGFELPAHLLALVTGFSRNLAVPQRRNADDADVLAGREWFYASGCAACHRPHYKTLDDAQSPHLSGQDIWPYTDLLLHDMGSELADNRPDFAASGQEWRTPPLWGVGLLPQINGSNNLLHDGRARSVEEAILWHGGEAAMARQAFVELNKEQRTALVRFVESL